MPAGRISDFIGKRVGWRGDDLKANLEGPPKKTNNTITAASEEHAADERRAKKFE